MHTEDEVQAVQLALQTKQEPFDKYLPMLHVEQYSFVDELQVKQL
jgi:hypothetical protein